MDYSNQKTQSKTEKQLIQELPEAIWKEIGIAISFLGRELSRPHLKCGECPIDGVCERYKVDQKLVSPTID